MLRGQGPRRRPASRHRFLDPHACRAAEQTPTSLWMPPCPRPPELATARRLCPCGETHSRSTGAREHTRAMRPHQGAAVPRSATCAAGEHLSSWTVPDMNQNHTKPSMVQNIPTGYTPSEVVVQSVFDAVADVPSHTFVVSLPTNHSAAGCGQLPPMLPGSVGVVHQQRRVKMAPGKLPTAAQPG